MAIGAIFRYPFRPKDTMTTHNERVADRVVRDVAELPDRTSPVDQPTWMLVSSDELKAIVIGALSAFDV